jgi:hypothetical protein
MIRLFTIGFNFFVVRGIYLNVMLKYSKMLNVKRRILKANTWGDLIPDGQTAAPEGYETV